MRIAMRLPAIAIAAALALYGPTAAAPAGDVSARPELLAKLPDGRRINFRCTGAGAPTVLLEGGYAATSLAWGKVKRALARSHRVCSYDRAGAGFSDPGPLPRDGAAIARDLNDALKAARIDGPYILVGHSAGGLYARLFSNMRQDDVVGMVLVDPSVEHQDRRFAAMFGPRVASIDGLRDRAARCLEAAERKQLPSTDERLTRCTPRPRENQPAAVNAARLAEEIRPSTWSARISELETLWGATSNQIDAGRQSYGDMPLIVLTADGTYAGAPEIAREALDTLWWGLHRELARRSTRGISRKVEGSSHMMMIDKPEVVSAAVLEVAAQAKARKR
jgi:pimeloyl-ACP methyl ester carboxylesterase